MKLSIITVNKNNAAGLEKTVQSVVAQTFTDFEYIVIDGGSDDGSVDIIKKYMDKITYWVSEPDAGTYNGMNKGIRVAHGEFCLFLNSGDWLIEGTTLQNVFDEIAGLPEAGEVGVYYSDCISDDNSFQKSTEHITTVDLVLVCNINHQNTIIRRFLFLQHGLYNENLTITADREFWLKEKWVYGSEFVYIKTNIAIYDRTGITSRVNYAKQHDILLQNVFGDLASLLIEWRNYRKSIYYEIIAYFGNTKILDFILRVYRYIAKRVNKSFLRSSHCTKES